MESTYALSGYVCMLYGIRLYMVRILNGDVSVSNP